MRARGFNKRIQLHETIVVPDNFGGNTVNTEFITETWADIRSMNANKPFSKDITQFGISNTGLAVIVKVRKRNDLTYNSINQFIIYAGEKYVISSFPENKNFDNSFITFVATKEDTKSVTVISPIGNAVFDYTLNFILG